MAREEPADWITQTSPFWRLEGLPVGVGTGNQELENLHGHVPMGAEHGGLPFHTPQQSDGIGSVPLGQCFHRLHRQSEASAIGCTVSTQRT